MRTAEGPLRLAALGNKMDGPRLGLIVGKRFLRRAVDRNRAKRMIRESFRQARDLPAMDIVVRVAVPKAAVSKTTADHLFAALVEIVARRASTERPDES